MTRLQLLDRTSSKLIQDTGQSRVKPLVTHNAVVVQPPRHSGATGRVKTAALGITALLTGSKPSFTDV